MPLTVRDLAWWIETECYALTRLEEKTSNDGKPTIYPGQVAAIRERLWRIHELLEELCPPAKKNERVPF